MPTPIKTVDGMTPGGRNGGKHWTQEEVNRRKEAAEGIKHKKRVTLKPPAWLSEEALVVWKGILKKLRDIELLDSLDTDLLAIYCDSIVKYQAASKGMATEEDVKAVQAWARIVVAYAEKLGLSPGGRARLAKKRAEKPKDNFGDTFDG